MKKSIVFAATLALSTLFATSAFAADGFRTLDEIKEDGTINIGVFSDKNPFGYVDENGDYQGYDVYFANRLGEDLGVDVNFVSTEAANRIEYLQTGKVDVILAKLYCNTRTCRRSRLCSSIYERRTWCCFTRFQCD